MFTFTSDPLPPSLDNILADRDAVHRRYPISHPSRWRISRRRRLLVRKSYPDTMSASFYRLYEFLVADWNIQFRNEIEYFCTEHPNWSISGLPDPADPDPVRYAVLAVLARLMCDAFNRRIKLGLPRDAPAIIEDFEELDARTKVYEQPPEWAARVPPVQERVFIPDAQGCVVGENEQEVSEEFRKINIIARTPHIHFI